MLSPLLFYEFSIKRSSAPAPRHAAQRSAAQHSAAQRRPVSTLYQEVCCHCRRRHPVHRHSVTCVAFSRRAHRSAVAAVFHSGARTVQNVGTLFLYNLLGFLASVRQIVLLPLPPCLAACWPRVQSWKRTLPHTHTHTYIS